MHLYYFRPGEQARMLARCQFGIGVTGKCGATLTYPIQGFPWRRNPVRSFDFDLPEATRLVLFEEVSRMQNESPAECLSAEQLWNDRSEKGNGITRDRETGTLCYTIALLDSAGQTIESYSMRETSPVLIGSQLFQVFSTLVRPYERL